MLLLLLLTTPLSIAVEDEETRAKKPYVILPVPLELPNRNDRSEQCWLRIEDVELTETITMYCYTAQAFLHNFIYEYNKRNMLEDKVYDRRWNEAQPRGDVPAPDTTDLDWQQTTVLDPIVNRRLFVSSKADCRIIMYSREGMTNYRVDCGKVLYFINVSMNSCAVCGGNLIFVTSLFLLLYNCL